MVTYNNTLTNGTQISVDGKPIPISGTGLIRIGDYENNNDQYDKPNTYVSYERK